MKTKNLILTALFAALCAVLAQIVIPIGPVPFNLAVFAAFLAGMLLQPKFAATSMVVYLLLGAIGVPVFAGLAGGPAILFGKTGGYVVGYIFIAFFTAFAVQKKFSASITICFMLLGLLFCYVFGTAWFMVITKLTLAKSLVFCVYPFIIPDIIKAVCAYLLGKTIAKRLK